MAGPHRIAHRLIASLTLVAFAGLLVGHAALMPSSATADGRTDRKMTITVNAPRLVISGTKATIRARATDQSGRAIKSATVAFAWRLPDGRHSIARTTNANGVATSSRSTDCGSAADYKAKVVVTATWRGQTQTRTRYFIITGGT
jgi:hypothetical protein